MNENGEVAGAGRATSPGPDAASASPAGPATETRDARRPAGRWRRAIARWLRLDLGFAVLTLILAGVVRTLDPAPVEMLRVGAFDLYQTMRPRTVTQYPVVIVDIDERSLAALGQWPWPRVMLADLVIRLRKLGAAAVGFDVIFAEPDRLSPQRVAEQIQGIDEVTAAALRRLPSNDAAFAQALRRTRTVIGQSVLAATPQASERPPPPKTAVAEIGGDPRRFLKAKYGGLVRNLAELETAATGRGVINPAIERDGIVRRVPAITQVGADLYPALAIELLRVATGQSAYAVRSGPDGIRGVVVARVMIPTDGEGRIWVRYSHHDEARYVSAVDVLEGTVAKQRIKGKLVLVGTSASGLLDIRGTPLGTSMPGVEIHAQLLENILARDHLVRPLDAMGMEIAITLAAGILMILLLPLIGARWTLLALAVVVAGAGLTSWYLFTERGILIDVVYAAIVTFLIYSLITYTNYNRAEAQRREVRAAFSRYLSPTLVEQLAEDPSRLQLGGEDRYMTLMFADVHNFTTISEQYDARALTRLINRLLTPLTDAILERRGTVDKYMGDAVMAFWNAPLDDPDHARNACMAALDMQARLGPLNETLRAEAEAEGRQSLPINVGIGLNSGECMVGNLGSEQRFDYSVMGDTVNLASRLEGQTRAYRVPIVVGESLIRQAPGLAAIELDLVRVVGKTVPERIFTVLGDEEVAAGEPFRVLKEAHDAMLEAYRAQDWEEALEALERCEDLDDGFGLEGYYDVFERRISEYDARGPGSAWDGIFVAKTK